jgi:hypothetical protein
MRFRIDASVGDQQGVFDAAYDFWEYPDGTSSAGNGEGGSIADEIGFQVARYLKQLDTSEVREWNQEKGGQLFWELRIRIAD